jgi:hypothetical protein
MFLILRIFSPEVFKKYCFAELRFVYYNSRAEKTASGKKQEGCNTDSHSKIEQGNKEEARRRTGSTPTKLTTKLTTLYE